MMKQQQRMSVFETNSSSSHSLSISTLNAKSIFQVPTIGKDGYIHISLKDKEFGWGYEEHNDFEHKLAYLLVYARSRSNRQKLLDKIEEVIKLITRSKGLQIVGMDPPSDEYWNWGYIDHQSYDVADEIFKGTPSQVKLRLIEYLFLPESYLIIDNDNH